MSRISLTAVLMLAASLAAPAYAQAAAPCRVRTASAENPSSKNAQSEHLASAENPSSKNAQNEQLAAAENPSSKNAQLAAAALPYCK